MLRRRAVKFMLPVRLRGRVSFEKAVTRAIDRENFLRLVKGY